ncbi:LysR substrate-binding domain-containing protein [Bordetella hinzii]|uniref:LysR substrate-binding domain-containing protein n=1 Tax=Bordetella hinzii TaxID=103855 RepID=UPI00045AA8DD|nr:LysR substrate-binding domain-containing protein [Bordetella hinzii]AKQ57067.1 HTH-type transcriptional regulator DmlR [Bordetella hinzii]KCB32166.1 transcriptional regulator YeaT [Bordetella hinzii L60]KCB50028.1 transcriptional regulator YeaT [Bordetella hinzii 1277]QDJ51076.1 LysR family transcriptional regulator [Bordetella hinzii]WPL81959.1 LysR substrate-binding domain-containing protein [Bordetella hinzii]
MNNDVLPADLRVFCAVARASSFSAAAEALGMSPAYVTKRIRLLEAGLGTPLFHRTTRRVVISEAGERVYHWAQRILDDVDHLVEEAGITRREPRGLLRVCSSFGYGRRVVAPALSAFVARHPAVQVRFEVFDRLVDVAAEGYDLDVRVGDDIAPHLIARKLAANHRVLCASPAYLAERGTPRSLAELSAHDCLVIKERDHPFGVWRLQRGRREQTVKVRGPLSANNGEMAVQWAVDGRGIILRSTWDVQPLIDAGKLVPILPQYRQTANVWAVYPARLNASAKVRACVEFLARHIPGEAPDLQAGHSGPQAASRAGGVIARR